MYYRRKILLGLLQAFDNNLEKIKLQKLLFLLSRFQKKSCYYFVPYKYGCYSFQSISDINTLEKYNIIVQNSNTVSCKADVDYLQQLTIIDKKAILDLKKVYGDRTSNELTKSTYISHPYYAINSLIAKNILSEDQYQKVLDAKPRKNKTVLFTIGYEGISLEEYLNKLIQKDIKLLCDVRNNALSMKYGFSKTQLKNACECVGIDYMHIPEVGIHSEHRQELNTQKDYDNLFLEYRKTTLANTSDIQKNIFALMLKYNRIALTCFESNICQCHRKPLAESISDLEGFKYEVRHI
ncbi:MAG: DUF488 domain-containing protein [Pedobacter sp.]|nr:MAG: DUF488 domain-containing protein [Pedobacter sp.]